MSAAFVVAVLVILVKVITYRDHEEDIKSAALKMHLGMTRSQVDSILQKHRLAISDRPTMFDESPGFRTRRCGLVEGVFYCSSGVFYFNQNDLLEAVSIESSSWDHKYPVQFLLRRRE